jgi:hypothetical protein
MTTRVHLNKKKNKKEEEKMEEGVAQPPLLPFFFLKKISLFIYFLINLYFFIKMDTWR